MSDNNLNKYRPGQKESSVYNPLHYVALDIYMAQEKLAHDRQEALLAALQPVVSAFADRQKALNAESTKAMVDVVQDVRVNARHTGVGKAELDALLQAAYLAQKEREEAARKTLEKQTLELSDIAKLQTKDIILEAQAHAARFGVSGVDPRAIESIRSARQEAGNERYAAISGWTVKPRDMSSPGYFAAATRVLNNPDFQEVSEVPSFLQAGRKPDGSIESKWAGGSIMRFAAPVDAKPHYKLQKVAVTIPGKGAFEDLVKRQIEVACQTGTLGGIDPLEILVDKKAPNSAALAVQLVKNLGFKLDPQSHECYFDTKEELRRRALVELDADRLIGSGEAKLVGHSVAGDGSACSFYVVALQSKENSDAVNSRGKALSDGDMFRIKFDARDGARTVLDESTAGYRQDLHECNLMRREVEYDAVRIYKKVVEGIEVTFNPKESAHLAQTSEQAFERWQQKELSAGNTATSTTLADSFRPPILQSLQESPSPEEKRLPPPLPGQPDEKAKSKPKKSSPEKIQKEKTVEKEVPGSPDEMPF